MHGLDDQSSALIFGPFRLQPSARSLERCGAVLQIGGRALDILIVLAEHAGKVVDKRELVKRVWAGLNVDEGSLRFHISNLRKVLGDGDEGARYIVNVPGRGYCLAAQLSKSASSSRELPRSFESPSPRSLPIPLSRMIGRDVVVDQLSRDLSQHRVITIVGPGGIGKTVVAIALAHRQLAEFDAQVVFIDFGALKDAALVPTTIASSLDLTASSNDPMSDLLSALQGRRMLLVFDSCEHILDTLAPIVERIARELPDLHILATSRESLRTENERVYRLLPLDCPPVSDVVYSADVLAYPATQLFVERIGESLSEFKLSDDEAPIVVDICRRLDGIALAIELAAGRVDAYGIAGTASLLDSRFSLLWRGRRTAIPRHRTLSAALDWSYDLLTDTESVALRRLSIFAGPFTLEAALAVASYDGISEAEAVEAFSNLLAKSLIATSPSESRLRYRLLNTTRVFAAEKLAGSAESDLVARAHAIHFRDFLEEVALDQAAPSTLEIGSCTPTICAMCGPP